MHRKSLKAFLLALLFFPLTLFAYNAVNDRTAFLAALSQLQQGHQQAFLTITENLRYYPLYPYLLYSDLAIHISQATPAQLMGFLDAYSNTPLAGHLRDDWLNVLAVRNQWREFLNVYQPTKNPTLECYQREALWQTGQVPEALHNFADLLNKNASLPKPCLWVFSQALQKGSIAQDLLWERIKVAVNTHNFDLANQLGGLLPLKDKPLFLLWQRVYNNPKLIITTTLPTDILLTGLQRLANQNPHFAAVTWDNLSKQSKFDVATQQKALRIVGVALAQAHDSSATAWLSSIEPAYTDKSVRDWRIRSVLYAQNWPAVETDINLLPPAEKKLPQWRYWQARAKGAQHQWPQAESIYRDLSLHGDFYGQLASIQLHQKPLMAVSQLNVTVAQMNAIATIPAIQRSYELYQLHWLPEATQEWQWAMSHMPEEDYLAAAELAIKWGWFERAIATVNLINDGGDMPLRFPLAYREPIVSAATRNNLNPAWVFALVRQESLFMPSVKSSAGALGLMQLMPNTALLVANQLHMRFMTSSLLDPSTNLYLGSIYLHKMLVGFNNNMILATAAYNAGPGNVEKWLPKTPMPADIWIETIPFHQTRGYVRNIMGSTTFYEKELQLPDTLSERMKGEI